MGKKLFDKLSDLKSRLVLLVLASSVFLSSCHAFNNQKEEEHSNEFGSEQSIDSKQFISDGASLISSIQEVLPDSNLDFSDLEKPFDLEKKGKVAIKKLDAVKETNAYFESIDLSSYHGFSIIDALNEKGYPSDESFRKELADYFEVENYDMSASKNLELLSILQKNKEVLNEKESVSNQQVSDLSQNVGNSSIQEDNILNLDQNQNIEQNHLEENQLESDLNQEISQDGPTGPGNSGPSFGSGNGGSGSGSGNGGSGSGSGNSGSNSGNGNGGSNSGNGNSGSNSGNGNSGSNSGNGNGGSGSDENLEEHKHIFGEWKYSGENKEKRLCSCGETEFRDCKFEKKILYEDLGNGNHQVVVQSQCVTCPNVVTVEKYMEICNYDNLIKVTDEAEFLQCVCKGIKESQHIWDNGKDNGDGTWSYHCIKEGCNHTKTVNHYHSFEKLVEVDDNFEYYSCIVDGCTVIDKREHSWDNGKDNGDGTWSYHCTKEGCNHTKIVNHYHQFKKLVGVDDDFEYYSCIVDGCTVIDKQEHSWDKGKDNGDGTWSYHCTKEGCNHTKTVQHIHQFEQLLKVDDDYEYYLCIIDGCTVIEKREHSWKKDSENSDGTINLVCSGCNHTKVQGSVHDCDFSIFVSANADGEIWKCKHCGKTTTVPHNLDDGKIVDGKIVYHCLNTPCTHVEEYDLDEILANDSVIIEDDLEFIAGIEENQGQQETEEELSETEAFVPESESGAEEDLEESQAQQEMQEELSNSKVSAQKAEGNISKNAEKSLKSQDISEKIVVSSSAEKVQKQGIQANYNFHSQNVLREDYSQLISNYNREKANSPKPTFYFDFDNTVVYLPDCDFYSNSHECVEDHGVSRVRVKKG